MEATDLWNLPIHHSRALLSTIKAMLKSNNVAYME